VSNPIKLSSPATREFWEIPVLFEDDDLLALDKPAGLPASPDPCAPDRPVLMQLLHDGIRAGKGWAAERKLAYLVNAHRLDPEISGVLLLARNKAALVALANLFGSEQPFLRYTALVQGAPSEPCFEISAKLAAHPARPGRVRVDPRRGKRAVTRFSTAERFSGWTLLHCEPLTARPHQIRVHLRWAGLPIVGDGVYGGKPLLLSRLKGGYRLKPGQAEHPLLNRVALHAEQLTVPHPATRRLLNVNAAWPKDLTVAVKYLRRYAPPGAG